MLRIGLTGGIASGKSTAAKFFADEGAAVFDADAIVAELYAAGRPGAEAVGRLFGPSSLAADGSVDRAKLGAIVFSDADARLRLEAVIHPMVVEEIGRRFEAARRSGASIAIAEASQIFEGAYENEFDSVVLVTAPNDVRRGRARERGLAVDDFDRRSMAQATPESAATKADHVIVNDGSIDNLRQKMSALFRELSDRIQGSK